METGQLRKDWLRKKEQEGRLTLRTRVSLKPMPMSITCARSASSTAGSTMAAPPSPPALLLAAMASVTCASFSASSAARKAAASGVSSLWD